MLEILSTANLQALKAVGEGNAIVKLEILKKPVFLIMTVIGAYISVFALAVTLPLYALYANIINMWPNKKILNYGIGKQLKDMMPASILSIFIFAAGYPINYLEIPDIAKILCSAIACTAVYALISHICKVESYLYCIDTLKNLKSKILHKK
jgi:hypothetical protein